MATVSVVTAQPGIPTASNGCTSTVTMRTGSLTTTTDHIGGPSGGRRGRSASVRAQLRDTRDGERRDDFDSARQRWRWGALPEPR